MRNHNRGICFAKNHFIPSSPSFSNFISLASFILFAPIFICNSFFPTRWGRAKVWIYTYPWIITNCLKEGGLMAYSSCSMNQIENECVVAQVNFYNIYNLLKVFIDLYKYSKNFTGLHKPHIHSQPIKNLYKPWYT